MIARVSPSAGALTMLAACVEGRLEAATLISVEEAERVGSWTVSLSEGSVRSLQLSLLQAFLFL